MKKNPIMEAKLEELWRNGHAEELRYLSDRRFNVLLNACVMGMCLAFSVQFAETILAKPLLHKSKGKTK